MGLRMLALAAGLLVTATAFAQEPQVYQPGNGVSAPTLVKDVRPSYTPEARRAKIQGMVHMTAVVREDGTVGNTEITQSLDTQYGLDAEAVKAANQWTFKPGMREGKAVPVKVTIHMAFTLPRQ
jgi:TonB family protein